MAPTQVEVALTEGKEMYAPLEGKHFSEEKATAILSHSFSTTGIFSSVARSLINSDHMAIEPKGSARLRRELLTQYEFHSLDGSGGWRISYSGQAGTAAEEGWFLVDGNRLLRRVSVSALDIPENLKLIGLRATIDYATEVIAGRRVLLPNAARTHATDQSGDRHTSLSPFIIGVSLPLIRCWRFLTFER